jgi:hypothetical protein
MNDRIQELEKQSYTEAMHEMGGTYKAFDKEKFAELIVRECIKDCRDMFVVDSVSWNLLNEKLEHFGVE